MNLWGKKSYMWLCTFHSNTCSAWGVAVYQTFQCLIKPYYGLWMWVQSANPLPCRVPVSSCQNQESCFSYRMEPISLVKDSPFSWCKFTFKLLNYTTQTKLELSGFQYSLAALHQLSIWPSVFPSSKQKIKRCFAREWQSLVRRNLFKRWELPIIFFKLQLSVLAAWSLVLKWWGTE